MKPSRAMIPGEILCAALGLVLAYFGAAYDGWLHKVLSERGEEYWWMVLLGGPALIMLVLSTWEWFAGSTSNAKFAKWRGRMVAGQGLCWLYAVYFGFDGRAELIGSIGAVGFGFCLWSYWENRRVTRETVRREAIALA